ncbi:hypothetical protein L2E82_24835 [Cichorium intybus]|uniref:Uncharacterized protein n=1 Tax=Cichorium intybus TaxID=13427 RepID=A0ACB9E1E1_CICIN|nr:hypothetical protein L2E82_24835 [Cichorium intybus]
MLAHFIDFEGLKKCITHLDPSPCLCSKSTSGPKSRIRQNWDRGFVFINGANSLAFLRLYDIHDKMICTHCQKSGEEEEEADVMPNESTKDCVGTPLEEDVGSWGHHSSPNTVTDTIFQASIGDEVRNDAYIDLTSYAILSTILSSHP